MRRFLAAILFCSTLVAQAPPPSAGRVAAPVAAASAQVQSPKLVLAIVIDQFRYDYLTRYKSEYTGGLKRLMDRGAVFTNAYFEHVPTVTAVGHSAFLSGATPAMSGIIANDWWERSEKKRVSSVTPVPGSKGSKMVGAEGNGSTPERLLQSTVGDELKMARKGGKVIGVSIKDRSAILPVGHMADAAYWFDDNSGNFVSATYYFPNGQLPAWVGDLNRARPGDKYAGREWLGHRAPEQKGKALYNELSFTPWGNELIQQAALAALKNEKLGTGTKVDLLAVSYSSNDYVGHRYGPDRPEAHDMALRVDKLIGELLTAAEAQAGAGRVLVALTADHGVAPVVEEMIPLKMPAGRPNGAAWRAEVEKALSARYGNGSWVTDTPDLAMVLNQDTINAKKLDRAQVEHVAAETLREQPHVFRVYTRTQLLSGSVSADQLDLRVRNGFNAARSPDLTVIPDPYWVAGQAGGTTHGTPFTYDAHVPVIFYGPQIKAGRYHFNIAVIDIAPTLSTILEIEPPSGSVGRALHEIIK
ncbi:MAG: alkaline phosphatase family protein [Bryobacteraceae bacterium]